MFVPVTACVMGRVHTHNHGKAHSTRPITLRVPCDTREDVATITPPVVVPTARVSIVAFVAVRLVNAAVIALRTVAKKLEEVALVELLLVVKKLVVVAFVITALVP